MTDRGVGAASKSQTVVVLLAFATLYGCNNPSLPTTPSGTLTAGIVVFEHANFLGESAHITDDISDLRDFHGPCEHRESTDPPGSFRTIVNWNDCISSVQVALGWRATLYRDTGYRDDRIEITADMPNLQLAPHDCPKGGLNDCVSALRVRRQ